MSGDKNAFLCSTNLKFALNQLVKIRISHRIRTPIEVELHSFDNENQLNRPWYYQKYQSYHLF